MNIFKAVAVGLMLSAPVGVKAQDFDAGLVATDARDYETAFQNWLPLAKLGDAAAQANLGVMYSTGKGVPQDYTEAMRWYRLAADQGSDNALKSIGGMYFNGNGVPQDYAEAMTWFRLAAEQGDAGAQNNLGMMYKIGWGVPQDNQTAHMWYNLAAASGNPKSGKWRDELAAMMTPPAIEEAQRRARVCLASKYQDCD